MPLLREFGVGGWVGRERWMHLLKASRRMLAVFSVKEIVPSSSVVVVDWVVEAVRVGSRSRFIATVRRMDVRWRTRGIIIGPGGSSRRVMMHCLVSFSILRALRRAESLT